MIKRLFVVLICLMLLLTGGCGLLPGNSQSGTDSPTQTQEPAITAAPDDSAAAATDAPAEEPTEQPTPEPTPTPVPTPAPDPGEGMIFPNSDTELLMWVDLVSLSSENLDLARNEIFARAGYTFTNQTYIDYYGTLSWYKADPNFSESNFSDIQHANITLIRAAESSIKGKLMEIKSGTKLDYDQDGVLETLTFTGDEYNMSLKMKDGTTTTTWAIECESPSKKVYLGDISFTDGVLDLFVDEAGPSDDYMAYVAGLKDKSFAKRDTVPGTISQFKLAGDGTVSTTRRMEILMTWFAKVSYKLNNTGKLALVAQASYSMDNFECKTKVDLPLKSSNDASSATALTVPAGTSVTLVSTDDKNWIKIKAPAGTGWLQMEDTMTLVSPHIAGYDAFDGLIMAD